MLYMMSVWVLFGLRYIFREVHYRKKEMGVAKALSMILLAPLYLIEDIIEVLIKIISHKEEK